MSSPLRDRKSRYLEPQGLGGIVALTSASAFQNTPAVNSPSTRFTFPTARGSAQCLLGWFFLPGNLVVCPGAPPHPSLPQGLGAFNRPRQGSFLVRQIWRWAWVWCISTGIMTLNVFGIFILGKCLTSNMLRANICENLTWLLSGWFRHSYY